MNLFFLCRRFLRKPWPEKLDSAQFRFRSLWFRLFPSIPLPIRLPYGGWWLSVDDWFSNAIFTDSFERLEWRFVNLFLRKGMTVLDIGAHHGFYTILASKKVGTSGLVIAFEPSPDERRRLGLHLKINRRRNVKVEPVALAGKDGQSTFFVIEGQDRVFNSLRQPAVSHPTKQITVRTLTLDHYLKKQNMHHVDFIKIDVEGAELEILKGAESLLSGTSAPVMMIEVDDIRTEPWGYPASRIIDYLSDRGYHWFEINSEGKLEQFGGKGEGYNFVAVPEMRLTETRHLIQN